MNSSGMKTLRLLFQEWQGGYDETDFPGRIYPFGARLLSWLAPESDAPLIEVPVPAWQPGMETPKEGGVFFREQILAQQRAALAVLERERPERVITFGGDCLVSLAPFAWLGELYGDDLAILWVDAHPDVTTPKDFDHAHAMVLGSLLGGGEPALAAEVRRHVRPCRVAYAGVDNVLPHERAVLDSLGLRQFGSAEIRESSAPVLEWLAAGGCTRLAVHLDMDVLDPAFFKSLLFTNPDVPDPIEAEHGRLKIAEVARLLKDLDDACTVVGMSFAEYMPWDAWNLKKALEPLSFMR